MGFYPTLSFNIALIPTETTYLSDTKTVKNIFYLPFKAGHLFYIPI